MRKVVLALWVAPALWAADGVIEINQASIQASGGFPYVISEPGSYKLTSNLNVPAGVDGIRIETDDGVWLDLNGFVLDGAGSARDGVSSLDEPDPGGNGVLTYRDRIHILNGTVRGFRFGVAIESGFVENVQSIDNSDVGILAISGRVSDCLASGGIVGINALVIENSQAIDNSQEGFRPQALGIIRGSYASGSGVLVSTLNDLLLLDNMLVADSQDQIAVTFGNPGALGGGSGYAGNVIIGQIDGTGVAIGCNTVNGDTICPAGGTN